MNELFQGESDRVEYKRERPKDSKKYLKTVVAFANGKGGILVFGVDDQSHEVVGIDTDMVFTEVDAITNTISDSCEPVIVPEIELQQVEEKTIIVVHIQAGMHRPYYLKSLGIENGTFIRSAATTRGVERPTLQELILEGSGRSLDSLVLHDQIVSKTEAETFCEEMTIYAKAQARDTESKKEIRPLTPSQLLSWGILAEENGHWAPTYAYCLLAGKTIPQILSGIQCGVFKGSTRATFVDRKFYDGPLYKQIDDAFDFVLRMIRMGAVIKGTVRQDVYEFPLRTIREAITNAVCHRSYFQPSYVQVALYDDRLEITSPGMIARPVSIEKMKHGFSYVQNRGIAHAFAYLGLIESWGSGIPRMFEDCATYGLREPELIVQDEMFRLNLYRKDSLLAATQDTTQDTTQDATQDATQDILARRQALLEFCEEPQNKNDMMRFLGLVGSKNFRNLYLQPLLDAGLLAMTIPDKPTSRYQKYVRVTGRQK